MTSRTYNRQSCQQLYNLYLKQNDQLGKGLSMEALMWKAISPSVPELIAIIDNDETLFAKIKGFAKQMVEVMEADVVKANKEES